MMDTPTFRPMSQTDIGFFVALLGSEHCITAAGIEERYTRDETEDLRFSPEVLLRPRTAEEVSAILRYANNEKLPVTVRGAGTGLAGGALPVYGGILLSMERFDRILEIDEANLQVTVEPGVITEVLQEAVKEKGLFYPPDPASRGWCHIGGNISTNSGGPKAVKYGVVKDYVINLQVVLPDGHIMWTGANTLKNSTGYNLTQLIVGSEGTLAVVTRIVLRLIPHPAFNLLMLVPFDSPDNACAAVSAIFRAGMTPSALEFMERDAIDLAMRYVGETGIPVGDNVGAHLLIEVDGNHLDTLYQDCERIAGVVEEFGAGEILFADNDTQKTTLWKLRRNVAHAVRLYSVYKEEDTVVPRAKLPELLRGVKEIGAGYGFRSICYGHAGDGNLHVNILKEGLSDEAWMEMLPQGITEIFSLVRALGGTISGEHGIGWVQARYMPIVFDEASLSLMRAVKRSFDPAGILNPGKLFPA